MHKQPNDYPAADADDLNAAETRIARIAYWIVTALFAGWTFFCVWAGTKIGGC